MFALRQRRLGAGRKLRYDQGQGNLNEIGFLGYRSYATNGNGPVSKHSSGLARRPFRVSSLGYPMPLRTQEDMKMDAENLLQIRNIEVAYNSVIVALKGVSVDVPKGKIVALLGANGAGKSTTLKTVSRVIEVEGGQITSGSISYRGQDITRASCHQVVKQGLVQVLEGRHVFPHLTVEENLLVPAYARRASRSETSEELEKIYKYFPRLKERRSSQAGFTSGGEQQMVAIGRALMAKPTLILLDEPSMGLAPQVVEEIFEIITDLNKKEAVTFLIAEQNTGVVLQCAHYAAILETGRVVLSGTAAELSVNPQVKELYLGKSGADAEYSIRQLKRYHRRKRLFA